VESVGKRVCAFVQGPVGSSLLLSTGPALSTALRHPRRALAITIFFAFAAPSVDTATNFAYYRPIQRRSQPTQLKLARTSGWGGKRRGAGRPPIPGRRPPVAHRARPAHRKEHPVHMTLRARAGLPSLRGERVFPAVREALRAASSTAFRVVQFSIQSDHAHLIVEANDPAALERGTRGLVIRIARAINRALGRSGPVWGDRYHARPLRTPREVRNGLVYVLMNFRKHRPADRQTFDPCSSAAWFDGFDGTQPSTEQPAPVCPSGTWLGSVGWRRHGPIKPWEQPRNAARPASCEGPRRYS
jgi:putative transposase